MLQNLLGECTIDTATSSALTAWLSRRRHSPPLSAKHLDAICAVLRSVSDCMSSESMSDVTALSDGRAELEAESPVSIVREPHIHHGIFMAGTRELGPQEADLKYEFYLQHIYMVRGVNVDGLGIPQQCYAEARACGLIARGQATWDQLRRLSNMLPTDKSLRWPQGLRIRACSTLRPSDSPLEPGPEAP